MKMNCCKAKLYFILFYIPTISEEVFFFQNERYYVTDKKKMSKYTNIISFIIFMFIGFNGLLTYGNMWNVLLIVLNSLTLFFSWIRLPNDIFKYLEKIESQSVK